MKNTLLLLPAASIIAVSFGFFNLYFFYNSFGIVIQNYLDVSEIIFSLITFLPSGIMFLLFTLYFLVAVSRVGDKSSNSFAKENKISKYFKRSNFWMLKKIAPMIRPKGLFLLAFTTALIFYIWYISESHSDQELLVSRWSYDFDYYILIILVSIEVAVISLILSRDSDFSSRDIYAFGMTMIVSLLFFLAIRNDRSARFIKNGHPKYYITLKTQNKVYRSCDSIYFVGSTRNYYFLFSRIDSASLIIPGSEIVEARIRVIRRGL